MRPPRVDALDAVEMGKPVSEVLFNALASAACELPRVAGTLIELKKARLFVTFVKVAPVVCGADPS